MEEINSNPTDMDEITSKLTEIQYELKRAEIDMFPEGLKELTETILPKVDAIFDDLVTRERDWAKVKERNAAAA